LRFNGSKFIYLLINIKKRKAFKINSFAFKMIFSFGLKLFFATDFTDCRRFQFFISVLISAICGYIFYFLH